MSPATGRTLRPPLRVALAEPVSTLPRGERLAYEPKFDGHRMLVFKLDGAAVLQARSGRIVTAAFPDLAEAALALPDGTVVDGEVVIWTGGRIDFAAVQRRAAATTSRAGILARRMPASYAAFDLLAEGGTDLRPAPYERRRERLTALLGPLGPPLQPVPMTTDPELATTWYETLTASGIEGLVVKHLGQPYRAGARDWRKLRHTDVHDAAVVGFTGPADRPAALVLVLPDDDAPVVSSPLPPALRTAAAGMLAGHGTENLAGSAAGGATAMAIGVGEVPFRPVAPGLAAEVERGTTRHSVVTVLRLRDDTINQV
ncbi:ATP-dependent DNA ligase [Streptomyces sp. NPDC091376]|uniref:ATP-dependent DNA ligase n=1 Tax=Streptomyces sp. NPDC091376 TaxID=3365994 RepID=UPI00381C7F25